MALKRIHKVSGQGVAVGMGRWESPLSRLRPALPAVASAGLAASASRCRRRPHGAAFTPHSQRWRPRRPERGDPVRPKLLRFSQSSTPTPFQASLQPGTWCSLGLLSAWEGDLGAGRGGVGGSDWGVGRPYGLRSIGRLVQSLSPYSGALP